MREYVAVPCNWQSGGRTAVAGVSRRVDSGGMPWPNTTTLGIRGGLFVLSTP